jgi:hypothetical protein
MVDLGITFVFQLINFIIVGFLALGIVSGSLLLILKLYDELKSRFQNEDNVN